MTTDEVLLLAAARRLASSGEGRRRRCLAGLSVRELATAVGVSHSALARWEAGERAPRGAAATEWARLLDRLDADAKAVA